jgi:hypothetical protein
LDDEAEEKPRERVLMCAADWKDPDCRTILGEFHKEGLSSEILEVDQDLEGFEKAWGDQGPAKFYSEYHKEGAPYLDRDGLSDHVPLPADPERPARPRTEAPLDRKLDMGTVEVISYALFRAIFGYGVNIPLKRPGLVDMDVSVKGRDININSNEFFFAVPDLVVWRMIYSHQGVPIVEVGRGVRNGMKVHRLHALKLFLSLWSQSRRAAKAKRRAKEQASKEQEAQG